MDITTKTLEELQALKLQMEASAFRSRNEYEQSMQNIQVLSSEIEKRTVPITEKKK